MGMANCWRKLTCTQVLTTLVALLSSSSVQSAPAPAPVPDCSSVLLGLAGCLDFVSPGSKMKTPKEECCTGLQSVLIRPADNKVAVKCLCDAFKNSETEYGVPLDMNKVIALPAACKINNFNVKQCQVGPAPTPGTAPVPAYSPPATTPNSSVPGTPSSGEAPSTQASGGSNSSSSSLTTTTSAALFVLTAITAVFLD